MVANVHRSSQSVSQLFPNKTGVRGGGDASARAHMLAASGRWVAFGPTEDVSRSHPALTPPTGSQSGSAAPDLTQVPQIQASSG